MDDKIIAKINKLLALAGNNPNEQEAMAAALKAQALMAEYNIELDQLKDHKVSKEIAEARYEMTGKHEVKTWRFTLANTIAKNFRCKIYAAGDDLIFYGYKEDAKIARDVFGFLYEVGGKLAVRYYSQARKEGRPTRGLMNAYLVGYCDGIKDVLGKQCVALMIVTPKEVEDSFREKTQFFATKSVRLNHRSDRSAYSQGRTDGQSTANARSITG